MENLKIRKAGIQILEKVIINNLNVLRYGDNEEMEDFKNEAIEELKVLDKRVLGFKKWMVDNNEAQNIKYYFGNRRCADWDEREIIENLETILFN